jgi:hypothetical protein
MIRIYLAVGMMSMRLRHAARLRRRRHAARHRLGA